MDTFLFFLLVTVILLALFFWSTRAKPCLPGIPQVGPRLPWAGHLLVMGRNRHRTFDWMVELFAKHKTHVCSSTPVTARCVVFLYPCEETVRHILKDNFQNYIISPSRVEAFHELFGNGIFSSNGDSWAAQRKAASHIFSLGRLRTSMTQVFRDHALLLIDIFNGTCKGGGRGTPFDAQDLFFKYTLDSFAKIAFGEETNSLTTGDSPMASSFDQAQLLCLPRFWDFPWRVKRFFNVGRERILKSHLDRVAHYTRDIIHRRRQDIAAGIERKDLIYEFLKAAKAQGRELSDDNLRDILLNFLVAGRDTTATALTWFFYEMTQRPDVHAKVAEECKHGLDNDPSRASYEVVEKLTYTHGALLEAIRLHPPVPSDAREAVADDRLPDGTFIPRGTVVNFHPYASGRSPDLWGDPLNFRPERWEEKHSEYKFPHFSAGPRLCLGRTLALLEAKICIAMLMCKFKFSLKEGASVTYQIGVTMGVKGGLPLQVTPCCN